MSNIDKQALRERYSPKPVPECHICGKEMTIQRMSASRITYGCTGATYDDTGCHYADGRSIADDHYEQSRVTVVDVSDPDVLALLDENIQLQRGKDAIEAVALALRDDMRDAREKLDAAERSIAELERSETQLINERDSAESALNDAYKAVMGQAPEWSNWFSFENAIDEIELVCELWRNQTDDVIQFRQHIANLEAQKADLMRHVLNAYEASALTMTLRKTVGYLPDYLRFCGIYGVDHEAIIDKLDYQSFVLARVNNEDLRQDEAGRYSKCEPPCGDDVAGQDAWFDAAESEGE
ncbi:TPA: ead/Ea22-like family protein [Salmonella enterica subsp. salamae serovar 21:z10:z6]